MPKYPYKPMGTSLGRDFRNDYNQNLKDIEDDIKNVKAEVSDKVFAEIIDSAKLEWKEPVNTFNNLPSGASEGDTRMVRDTGKVYRFDGQDWKEIQQIDAGPVNEVDSRLSAQLAQKESYITYEMFGAVGDGATDDGMAIRLAHEYANEHNLPIYSQGKTYYIQNERLIPIETSTDWNNAKIILDEDENPDEHVFVVRSKQTSQDIPVNLIDTLTLSPNTISIPQLASLGHVLLVFENANKKQYIRYGVNADSGTNQRNLIILNNGTVELPFTWIFNEVTKITAYPIDADKLTISNANFVSISNTETTIDSYIKQGINIRRSNVIADNINHVVEERGVVGRPSEGFFSFSYCTNVTFKNSKACPRKSRRNQDDTATIGTYDISLFNVCNITFDNIEGFTLDEAYWGVLGTNYVKNWTVLNSKLSRIDCHRGAFGLTIKDTIVGRQGIMLNGGGKLTIENLTSFANYVIDLRNDYGATWDGPIRVKSVEHFPNGIPTFLRARHAMNHDFGYPCRLGKMDVVVEDYMVHTQSLDIPLLSIDISNKADANGLASNEYKLTKLFSFKNCKISNPDSGFYLLDTNFYNLRADRNFKYTVLSQLNEHARMLDVEHNITFELDDVQFRDTLYGSLFKSLDGIGLSNGSDDYLSVNNRLLPKFLIKNCREVKPHIGGLPSILQLENCSVLGIYANISGTRSVCYANNCIISPKNNGEFSGYAVRVNRISGFFKNCQFNVPKLNGVEIKPNGSSSNDNSFRRLYDFFANIIAGSNDFVVYGNFNNCLFDPKMELNRLVSNNYTRQDFSKIGNTKYTDRFLWLTANTASRPSNPPQNFQYYDTTLEKLIWWDGTKWIDATGATV